jgi:hypothetical protein
VALFVRAPETFLAWVWMALLFEERTIDISRRYRAAPAVAPLFRKVHHLHMVEEAQHVELDKLLLERLFAAASPQVRALNARLFKTIMARLAAPQRIPLAALAEAARRNPELASQMPRLRAAVAGLGANRRYQEAFFSRRALPVTCGWLDRFPEMHALAQAMPAYDPPPSGARGQEVTA